MGWGGGYLCYVCVSIIGLVGTLKLWFLPLKGVHCASGTFGYAHNGHKPRNYTMKGKSKSEAIFVHVTVCLDSIDASVS